MYQLKGFDGIRAIACFMVIFHHVAQIYNPAYLSENVQTIWFFFYSGQSGVSVFFVLSGALLAYPFFYNFTHKKSLPSIKQYIARRFFRIAPAYYLTLLVSALFAVFMFDSTFNSQFIYRFISGLTFTSALSATTLFPTDINGPLWSIGFEFISYLFLLVFMVVLFKFANNGSITQAVYLFFVTLLIVIACHLAYLRFTQVDQINAGWEYGELGGARTWFPYYNVFSLFAHFLMGMLAAMVLVMINNKNQQPHKSFTRIIIINTLIVIGFWYFSNGNSYGLFEIQYYWPIFPIYVASTLILIPFTPRLADLLDNRFFKFTAKISFGLYLWHFLIIRILANTLFENYTPFNEFDNTQYMLATSIMLMASYIVASCSYFFLEQPLINYSKNIADKKSTLRLKEND